METDSQKTNIELLVENTVLKAVAESSKEFDKKLDKQQERNETLLQKLHDDNNVTQQEIKNLADAAMNRANAAHNRLNSLWLKIFGAIGAVSGIPALLVFLIDHRK